MNLKYKLYKFFNYKFTDLNKIKIDDVNPLIGLDSEDMLNSFTSNKIIFEDGTTNHDKDIATVIQMPQFNCVKKFINLFYQGQFDNKSLVDLGCLEGAWSYEFAKMGFDVTGIEVRKNNFKNCEVVKEKSKLKNLNFKLDTCWNLNKYKNYDVIFCNGLLYHLDRPKKFLEIVYEKTNDLFILDTHFSLSTHNNITSNHFLSEINQNEGLRGRWYYEYNDGTDLKFKEKNKWRAYENNKSFWILKDDLITCLYNLGFKSVIEFYDIFKSHHSELIDQRLRSVFIATKN
jgi:2-polyprenyl-3-methyl-5-hydroxy-6-metoxy-1,4-benzoquinol methylase